MGVALLDLVAHKVGRRCEGDMARHAPRHARVEQGDLLTLGVEDAGPRVSLEGEVLLGVVEDSHLPGGARQVADDVSLELGEPSKGQVGGLALFGDDEAAVAKLVEEIGLLHVLGLDEALEAEEMVGRVFEGGRIGVIRIKELGDITWGEFSA